MELAMAMLLGAMFACGTYLILRPNLIRIVLGFGVLSNAVNLMMITAGGYQRTSEAPSRSSSYPSVSRSSRSSPRSRKRSRRSIAPPSSARRRFSATRFWTVSACRECEFMA